MTETDENESKTRRIRLAMELKDKNGFFLCEFQNEKKKWLNYCAAVMLKIAETLDEDQTIVELDESEIDLNRLIETNSTTKQKRKIHFVKSSESTASEGFFRTKIVSSGEISIERFDSDE